MQRVLLLREGEIFLKGRNKKYFESILLKNIKQALSAFEYTLKASQNRFYVEEYAEENERQMIMALTCVFGLHSISPAVKIATEFDQMKQCAADAAAGAESFRVTCKRADKNFGRSSTQVASEIGAYILDKYPNMQVDLHTYAREITVDIRENGWTYIFSSEIMGAGGLPVGSSGTGLLLLSGGIDSPVAGFKMAQRGVKIQAVHFASPPYTSEAAKQKVIELAERLKPYNGGFQLHVVPFTEIQIAIHQHCDETFMITIMRRIMMRIAERLCGTLGAGAIVTGESLGQVASQTMQSITVVNHALELIPVLRPLIGMDKDEIIQIAHKIDTYKTSILPYEDCCTVFLPKNPVIQPKLERVLKEESKLDIESLIESAMHKIEIIEI